MPAFELNRNAKTNARAYGRLSAFAQGYVEAMFFTNGDLGDDTHGAHYLNELGVARLTRQAIARVVGDCDRFLAMPMPDGATVGDWLGSLARPEGYDEEKAGRDLWFTRRRHGAGYWDREELELGAGDALTTLAHAMGEVTVDVVRGWIYHS
jgi:hypothetical protein